MKFSAGLLLIVLLFVLTLFAVNIGSALGVSTKERTFTGFYLPTGTGDLGNSAEWLDNHCTWDQIDNYAFDDDGNRLYHTGWDIDAAYDAGTDMGDPVYAIADGFIVFMSGPTARSGWGDDGDHNYAILVEHETDTGDKFLAVYGHVRPVNEDLLVGDSQPITPPLRVMAGDEIATIGPFSTPHLHFGIRENTFPRNSLGIIIVSGRLGNEICPGELPDGDDVDSFFSKAENTNSFVDPIEWITTKTPKLENPIPDSVDVVLIIDSSGSMTSNDPDNKRRVAARVYLTASLEGDFVGVVDFDGGVRRASDLLRLPENKDSLITAINTINSSGGTNIGIGVQEGCEALIESSSENVKKAAILLTNGAGSFAGQDECFSSRGWPIYTFGLGSGADHPLLRQIAENTGGEHTELPASALVCEFQRVRSKIAGVEPGFCKAINILSKEFGFFIINVESGLRTITFSIDWGGSDVVLTLTTPSGRVIDRSTDAPDVEHDQGATFEVYTITNPEPGDWEVSLFGADVPPEGEEVTFSFVSIPGEPEPVMIGGTTSFFVSSSGASNGGMAALAGGATGVLAILGVAGWYTRRRWLKSHS